MLLFPRSPCQVQLCWGPIADLFQDYARLTLPVQNDRQATLSETPGMEDGRDPANLALFAFDGICLLRIGAAPASPPGDTKRDQ